MIRVGDLTQYNTLPAGSLLPFTADFERSVRLTVNAPHRSLLSVVALDRDGEPTDDVFFLATVEGLNEIIFEAKGAFALTSDGDVYVRTFDGEMIHSVVPDDVTFTELVEKRPRNPEMERLEAMLLANQERRMAPLYADLERQRDELYAERTLAARTGDPVAPSPEPEPRTGVGGGSDDASPSPGAGGSDVDA